MKTRSICKTVIILSSIFLLSCTKEVVGPKGETGAAGKNGNSNQTHTSSFVVSAGSWDLVDLITEQQWQTSIYVAQITPQVIQSGEVNVYTLVEGNWWSLPFYEGQLVTQFSISNGLVNLRHSNVHGQIPARPADRSYRVVITSPK